MRFQSSISSPVVRNAAWMLYGQGGRLVLQAAYFIVLARTLGVSEFGVLAATAALAAIFGTFSGMGSGDVLVMRVARQPAVYPVYFGNALLTTVVSSLPLGVLFAATAAWMLPGTASTTLIVGLIVSEFIFARCMEQCAQAFVALDRHRYTAHIFFLMSAARATGAVVFMSAGGSTAEQWILWLVALNGLAMIATVWITITMLGRPRTEPWRALREIRHGVHFSIGLGAKTVYSDIDKAMLGRLATFEAAGTYTAAYRLVAMAFVPVSAVLYAGASRFFRMGEKGVDSALQWGRRLLPFAIGYGVVVAVGIYLGAPLIPMILGDDYVGSVEVLKWLSVLPVLQALHFVLADTLTGANLQYVRSTIQIAVAAFNVGLCYWLIGAHGIMGACWAALASESVLAVSMTIAILYARNKQYSREATA